MIVAAGPDSAGRRIVIWASWITLVAAFLSSAFVAISAWATNAPAFGARDLGTATSLAYVRAPIIIGAAFAIPPAIVVGLVLLFIERRSGYRFLAAGILWSLLFAKLN
jgi:hypothetical protein